ncbi:ABC transporter permease [Listeria grandensis]|uniref:Transport permease protein n=1 Tax=Listeria grandensis TaxID=1494963 RepID=A0A7X0Y3X7_9LIST|nr:ABC transporter permease [Listeria grandensis]MBC1475305.1 ABC transporter permease [Listeria grandensis]MBC1936464.1 ABC transporter permease [Listeria grandensis]MBC6316316.1 ABC transporter permease [Listeria grandensis]
MMRNNWNDMQVMVGRNMKHAFRSADTIITTIAMPLMIMLMFVYVFGGSIDTGSENYINYVVPGIMFLCIAMGTTYTAVRLSHDVTTGIIDRFHSMPIAKSSILTGHVVTSVVFNLISTLVIVLVAFLLGFRPEAGFVGWLVVILILLLFTLAMTWIAVISGLLAKSPEGSASFSYLILLLLFISSAFAPTDSMNKVVRAFAENQPMTPIIESVRSLLVGNVNTGEVWTAIAWCGGIFIVAMIASMQIYKRKTE